MRKFFAILFTILFIANVANAEKFKSTKYVMQHDNNTSFVSLNSFTDTKFYFKDVNLLHTFKAESGEPVIYYDWKDVDCLTADSYEEIDEITNTFQSHQVRYAITKAQYYLDDYNAYYKMDLICVLDGNGNYVGFAAIVNILSKADSDSDEIALDIYESYRKAFLD